MHICLYTVRTKVVKSFSHVRKIRLFDSPTAECSSEAIDSEVNQGMLKHIQIVVPKREPITRKVFAFSYDSLYNGLISPLFGIISP